MAHPHDRNLLEKLQTLNDIFRLTDFFFVGPAEYEEKAVKKYWQTAGTIKTALETLASESGDGPAKFVHPLRLALTGKSVGPGLFELAELLGQAACLCRLQSAIEYLNVQAKP